jgi:molybdate/tungstate transport system substrate-binding protein
MPASTSNFHQLDLRVDKRWVFNKWILNTYLDVQNAYNRSNPEGLTYSYDYSQSKPQSGLPILTIFGVRAELQFDWSSARAGLLKSTPVLVEIVLRFPPRPCALAVLAALVLCGCKSRGIELAIFHATSLSAVLGDAVTAFQKDNPGVRIRLEPSGSQVAARKLTELGMRADIIAVADAALIDNILIPSHATWNAVFATNAMAIAHKDHSKWTDQIGSGNWPEILTRPGVRLGRADPDTAPVGYYALMVWQLAESSGLYGGFATDLSTKLQGQCALEHVSHDEAELLGLLESRAVDYAFLFRSTAEDHHLKILELPPEINLSRQDMAPRYAAASVFVRMKRAQGPGRLVGAPVTYGVTIPGNAPHKVEAARFAAFLLGEPGRRLLVRRGFRPATPVHCNPCVGLPAGLSSTVQAVIP